VLIFAAGLGVRLYRLSSPPLDFPPARQLHSALIARGMYSEQAAAVPAWQREMAITQWHAEGVIEPQVFERLVAFTYSLAGRADLVIPRLYAVTFWMIAALFLAWVAYELSGWGGAVVAALFFLAWPYGVVASRAFQPEALFIALMVAALWAGLRWERKSGWGWAIATGLLAGLSIYIKSVAVFFLAPALIALVVCGAHRRRFWRNPQVWVLGVLAVLPALLFLADGLLWRGYLVGQFSQRFFPAMWLDPAFYLRWISNLGRALPFEMVLVAIAGIFLVREPAQRAMLLAMWPGYFVFGMTLPHHISTHDYYHLPLFPVVALGLGAVGRTVFEHLHGPRWFTNSAITGLILVALVINGYDARTTLKRSDTSAQVATWQAVGAELGPGASVVALVTDYGVGLEYWAWINPVIWPTTADLQWQQGQGSVEDFEQLFRQTTAGKEYFVVAAPDELATQPALRDTLHKYPIYRQGAGYQIYSLRKPDTVP
ncbi:MAG: glycosyltransferase family 39 protein, partial [Anaerolineaceae bacterium]|nr:glycosyltransferase family 39 protein [Anaerolineaceae bacterium]